MFYILQAEEQQGLRRELKPSNADRHAALLTALGTDTKPASGSKCVIMNVR